MEKCLEKLFTPAAGEWGELFEQAYSSLAIKANFNIKLDLLVEELMPFITMGFSSATASGFNLNAAFVARFQGSMKQELEAIKTIQKIPSITGHSKDSIKVLMPHECILHGAVPNIVYYFE